MSDCSHNPSSANLKLVVSIVLYRPDIPALLATLVSIRQELEAGTYDFSKQQAEIRLTDHTPAILPDNCFRELVNTAGNRICLNYDHVGANPGFGAGHNHAFDRGGQSEYVLIANPDIEILPGSLAASLAFLDEHPEIGVLAPALVTSNGTLQPACFRYPDVLTLLSRFVGGVGAVKRSYYYECRDWDPTEIHYSPLLISGCCMLVRSTIFSALGGFDPRYFLYFEDFDFSMRANSITHTVYFPKMRVIHKGGGVGRKGIRHIFHYVQSALRFFAQYGWHCFFCRERR